MASHLQVLLRKYNNHERLVKDLLTLSQIRWRDELGGWGE